MDLYNYQNVINDVANNTVISKNEIYDFQNEHLTDELKDTFKKYFIFCQTNLKEHNTKFNIQPARFYFKKDTTNNAEAKYCYQNGYFLISLNSGLFNNLNELLNPESNLFESNNTLRDSFRFLIIKNQVSLYKLMFQSSTLFAYYHELGHLIQFSGRLGKSLNLNKNEVCETDTEVFEFNNHLDEYDSDLYGANAVLIHLLDYFDDLEEEFKNAKNYENILSLGLSSIIVNFLLLLGNTSEITKIYYRESDHPHIHIRIFYLLDHFISNSKDDKYNIEGKNILNTSLHIVSQFYQTKHLFDNLINNFENIKQYCDDIYDGSENLMYLARHKQ